MIHLTHVFRKWSSRSGWSPFVVLYIVRGEVRMDIWVEGD